jgi:hypothetical protein
MARAQFERISRRLRAEDGMALALAVSMVSVLAIGVTSGMLFTSTNAGASKRSSVDQTAYAAAEAGVNNAFAVLSLPGNNAFDPYLLPERTSAYAGGTVRWWGTLNQATSTWKVHAVATVQNPTGPSAAPVTRRLTADVAVSPALSQPLNNMGWNYIWATGTGSPSGCDMTIQQSVNVMSPLYVEGNLCLQNTATIGAGPLVVKGKLSLQQKANAVGTSSAPVNEVHLGDGCEWWNKGWSRPCRGNQDNVNARALDTVPPPLSPPVPAWSNWYLNASPGRTTRATSRPARRPSSTTTRARSRPPTPADATGRSRRRSTSRRASRTGARRRRASSRGTRTVGS